MHSLCALVRSHRCARLTLSFMLPPRLEASFSSAVRCPQGPSWNEARWYPDVAGGLAQRIAVPFLSVMMSFAHEIDLLGREARWCESAVRLILCAELRMDYRRVFSQCHIASTASSLLSVR